MKQSSRQIIEYFMESKFESLLTINLNAIRMILLSVLSTYLSAIVEKDPEHLFNNHENGKSTRS